MNGLVSCDCGGQSQIAPAGKDFKLIRPDALAGSLARIQQEEENERLSEECKDLCTTLLRKYGIQMNICRVVEDNWPVLLASNGLLAQNLEYFSRRKKIGQRIIWGIFTSLNMSTILAAVLAGPEFLIFLIFNLILPIPIFAGEFIPRWFSYNFPKIKKFLERQPAVDNQELRFSEKQELCLPK